MAAGTIISLLSALLSIVKLIAQYADNKQLLDAGAAQAVVRGMEDAQTAVDAASEARRKARDSFANNPPDGTSNGLPDDGYRRD